MHYDTWWPISAKSEYRLTGIKLPSPNEFDVLDTELIVVPTNIIHQGSKILFLHIVSIHMYGRIEMPRKFWRNRKKILRFLLRTLKFLWPPSLNFVADSLHGGRRGSTGVGLSSAPNKIRFCPGSDAFPLCHYSMRIGSDPPVIAYYQMKVRLYSKIRI